jgi:hypothetical protein
MARRGRGERGRSPQETTCGDTQAATERGRCQSVYVAILEQPRSINSISEVYPTSRRFASVAKGSFALATWPCSRHQETSWLAMAARSRGYMVRSMPQRQSGASPESQNGAVPCQNAEDDRADDLGTVVGQPIIVGRGSSLPWLPGLSLSRDSGPRPKRLHRPGSRSITNYEWPRANTSWARVRRAATGQPLTRRWPHADDA